MKKSLFNGIGLLGLFLCACQPSDDVSPQPKVQTFPVCFTLHLHKQIFPFPSGQNEVEVSGVPYSNRRGTVKSIPDIDIPDPTVPGATPDTPGGSDGPKEIGELCNCIDYFVYAPGDGNRLVKHKSYPSAADDFGIVYDSLPPGHYQLVFVAHSSTIAQLNDNRLLFEPVTDVFYATTEAEIKPAESNQQDVALGRIVGKIEFLSTEPVPPGLTRFTVRIERYPERLDILSGVGAASDEPRILTWDFSAGQTEKTNEPHSFYTFIPAVDETFDVELLAIGTGEQLLRRRTLKGIRPVTNRIVRYSGALYSSPVAEGSFNLEISGQGEWGGTDEKVLAP